MQVPAEAELRCTGTARRLPFESFDPQGLRGVGLISVPVRPGRTSLLTLGSCELPLAPDLVFAFWSLQVVTIVVTGSSIH